MSLRSALTDTLFLLVAASVGPIVALWTGDTYTLVTFQRILIVAVAAASLNMILGYGGMVNFGHAAFLGIGAYAVGLLANAGITNLGAHIVTVIIASGLVGLVFGAIALRTSSIFFIMITLALAQILYYLAVSSSTFGGDDGLVIDERSTLGGLYDPFDPYQFYALVAAFSVVLILMINHLVRSDFGRRLVACRDNPVRAEALGFNVFATKLSAFVLSCIFCGLAGLLLANQTEFASPDFASWRRSGELLVIVILGGTGKLYGPLIGAFAFILIEHTLSQYTTHWAIIFGPFLILAVLFFRSGLAGVMDQIFNRLGWRVQ